MIETIFIIPHKNTYLKCKKQIPYKIQEGEYIDLGLLYLVKSSIWNFKNDQLEVTLNATYNIRHQDLTSLGFETLNIK